MEFSVEELLEKFRESLWLCALSLTKDHSLADDIIQEMSLKAYQNFDDFEMKNNDVHSFFGWARAILKNVWVSNRRAAKARKKYEIKQSQEFDIKCQSALNEVIDNEVHPLITEAVNSLPEHQKETFLLRTQGFEYKEIAAKLDVKIGTTLSRVDRARTNIKKFLINNGYKQ